MHKKILFILLFMSYALSSMADTLTIVNRFEKIEHASVLASYRNEFGSYRKPNLNVEFPYALIRVHIEGNELAVTKAKERFALYLGQHYTTKAKNTSRVNEIMFLVPIGAGHVELQCGDGCQPLVLFDDPQLSADAIYEGKVRYSLTANNVITIVQGPQSQYFKFRVTPSNATVRVVENGKEEIWDVKNGMATKELHYGRYRYIVEAERYHTEEGEFTVSENVATNERVVALSPQFGWLTVESDATSHDANVYITNHATKKMTSLGTVPVVKKELDSGTYTLSVKREKYLGYEEVFSISDTHTTTIRPHLVPNFVRLTLSADANSEVYNGLSKLGNGGWTGELECGEYSIEVRKPHHYSAYTNITVNMQSAGKTIALNAPIPKVGSLKVNGSPYDATVYVDGKLQGTSPLVVNKLLEGEHVVKVEKDGYGTIERKVVISEGQEQVINYELVDAFADRPGLKPFPLEPVQVGDLWYMPDVDDPYSVEVVACCNKQHISIPKSITYQGQNYPVVRISNQCLMIYGDSISFIPNGIGYNNSIYSQKSYKPSYSKRERKELYNDNTIPCRDLAPDNPRYYRAVGQGFGKSDQEAKEVALQSSILMLSLPCFTWEYSSYDTEKNWEYIWVQSDFPTLVAIEYTQEVATNQSVYQLRSILTKEWIALFEYEIVCEKIVPLDCGLYECWIAIQVPRNITDEFIAHMKTKGILQYEYEIESGASFLNIIKSL